MDDAPKCRLPLRKPQFKVATRLNVSKPYFVILPNGNVYEFETLNDAQAYKQSHTLGDSAELTPQLFRSADFTNIQAEDL
jgi:hypothetical protein